MQNPPHSDGSDSAASLGGVQIRTVSPLRTSVDRLPPKLAQKATAASWGASGSGVANSPPFAA